MLLTAKADLNARAAKFSSITALQAATKRGHFEVVEMLLTAKVAQEDVRTALQAAESIRDERLIKLLNSAVHKS